MKKILPVFVFLALIAFLYQLISNFFVTYRQTNYSLIASDQNKYDIFEEYKKNSGYDYYFFTVKKKKKLYSFMIEKNFNKQSQIITDIKYYRKENLECILPIYKKDTRFDVSCLLDGKQVSPFYLLQTNNKNFSDILKKLNKDGYDDKYYDHGQKNTEKNLSIYYDNIPNNYIFTIWNYRGINVIKNDQNEIKKFLNEDYYENNLSIVVDNYYVTVNTDDEEKKLNYYQFIVYDLIKDTKSLIEVELSQNIYFNGVSNGKLYITDPKQKKQYVLDPAKKKIKELDSLIEVKNSKLITGNNNIFLEFKVDSNNIKNNKITKLYDTTEIKKDNGQYYFKTNDGKLYVVVQNNYEHPILLCQFSDIKEWQVHDNGLSFIINDTLYFYNSLYGLHPILVNPEFKYNYKNISNFIREE